MRNSCKAFQVQDESVKETYYMNERDLLHEQKRPTT